MPDEKLISEWSGFTVYDAETGENLSNKKWYLLDCDGALVEPFFNGNNLILLRPSKKGKFLIQFGDSGMYMRW